MIVWCYSLQDDVFSYEKLLIPVNTGAHWTLAVVDFAEKEFRYYDSMLKDNMACLQRIRFTIGSASKTLVHYCCSYFRDFLQYVQQGSNFSQWKMVYPKVSHVTSYSY